MEINTRVAIDINRLRRLYKTDSCAKSLLDYIAGRKYNSAETSVDRLESILSGTSECDRREIVGALKQLEELSCGRFLIGRRGQPSRFEWTVQMIDVGKASRGEEVNVAQLDPEEATAEEDDESQIAADTIRHVFKLRPDWTVTIELPANFSQKEAWRLSEFVKTLPFDGDNN